ncbi:Uncharacterised protein [Mobiluncus mulieris]|nr:Uncharacterised protein [Mobiluncus mulieris]
MGMPNSVITGVFFPEFVTPAVPRARTRETVIAQIPHKSPKFPLVSPPVPLSQRLRRSRWRSGVRRKRGTGG